jgi:hypothetical protein
VKDVNAQSLLAAVMGWTDPEVIGAQVPALQLLADFKYDSYQRFGPGKRFIESLALWLKQFDPEDRMTALSLIQRRLIFVSDQEMSHLVQLAYPDVIAQERLRLVAEENGIAPYRVGELHSHPRFEQLRAKSLYLGLSDGAHTNELRRASNGAISNEQIWQAYELGEAKTEDMLSELRASLGAPDDAEARKARFSLVWLVDDFSGSGNTYIRFDSREKRFKGKIKKIYDRIRAGDLVDTDYYEVYLLLYVATRQAIDHIEYWSERFTTEQGLKPLRLHVLHPIEKEAALSEMAEPTLMAILSKDAYYDSRASDRHIAVGGTSSAQLGFANCALPLVLSHNTPNNSVYALWGPESFSFFGLFPRVSRHRET